jgi:MFS family permease
LVILFGLGYFIVQTPTTLAIILIPAGMCWALVNVNSLPLVYDYGDENKIGAYTGLYYFSSQSAAILGPVLSGALVESLGNQYRWLWVFGTVFMALAWVAIQGVRQKATPEVQPNA